MPFWYPLVHPLGSVHFGYGYLLSNRLPFALITKTLFRFSITIRAKRSYRIVPRLACLVVVRKRKTLKVLISPPSRKRSGNKKLTTSARTGTCRTGPHWNEKFDKIIKNKYVYENISTFFFFFFWFCFCSVLFCWISVFDCLVSNSLQSGYVESNIFLYFMFPNNSMRRNTIELLRTVQSFAVQHFRTTYESETALQNLILDSELEIQ